MASTGLNDINQLTPDNGAIRDLKELLFLKVLLSEALASSLTVQPGALHGHKIGGVGEMGAVGTIQSGCEPTFNSTAISMQEKSWDLGRFTVAEQICFEDLLETLARYGMKEKTSVSDMTGTDFMDIIVTPALSAALDKMLWRLYWFGDKTASNVTDGGIITDGIDPALFHVCDGLFKRLLAITAANPLQRVTIAANTETTRAAQIAGIRAEGVARGIFEDLVYNADMRIRQSSDKKVLCTQSLADALAIDAKRITGSNLQWESLFGGLASVTQWNGETIFAFPIWDEMIAAFESTGTALNKPHRAVYAPISNLWGGVASRDLLAELQIWFSQDLQVNRMLARDEIGTLVWEDALVQYAY